MRLVKILDRHMAQRLIAATGGAILAMILLFTVIDLATHQRSEIIENAVPARTVAWYYLMLVPETLVTNQVAGLSVLAATLLVLGGAAQHSEFTALLACGVPLRRIARVPVLVAGGISVLLFVMSETVGPVAARESRAIEAQYFGGQTEGVFAERGPVSWANLDGGWTCHVEKFNRIAYTGEGVLMLSQGEDRHQQIRAERVFWEPERGLWLMEDGIWSTFYPREGMAVEVQRVSQGTLPLQESPEELLAAFRDPATLSAVGLREVMRRAASRGMPTAQLEVDFQNKFSMPALPLVIVWLAVPFAARFRRGGVSFGFGASIGLGLVYLLLFSAFRNLGYVGQLPPVVASWGANLVFLFAGVVLVARTPT